jgi:hypothetical protein
VRPTPSSLPGTSPVAPSRSPATPCHRLPCRRAADEHATPLSHAQSARGDYSGARAARARCRGPHMPFSPLGRAARLQPRGCFDRQRVAGRHAMWVVVLGRFSAQYCARGFKCFSIVLKFQKIGQTSKNCRNVQKFQNKFYGTPLEPLFTVGLTKLAFTH